MDVGMLMAVLGLLWLLAILKRDLDRISEEVRIEKLCIDCQWYAPLDSCVHHQSSSGKCYVERARGLCGREGIFWQKREDHD